MRYRGFEEALRADLSSVMSDKLDSVGLIGQAAVNNVSPAIEGLISQLPDPTNPTAVATWADYLEIFSNRVDGKYSLDGSNVRVLCNVETLKHARRVRLSSTGQIIALDLPAGRFRASANMPAVASDIATAVTYASGRRGFVQPVWRGINLIRDPYSNAAEGQVALTVSMFTGAAMVDSGPYSRLEFKVA